MGCVCSSEQTAPPPAEAEKPARQPESPSKGTRVSFADPKNASPTHAPAAQSDGEHKGQTPPLQKGGVSMTFLDSHGGGKKSRAPLAARSARSLASRAASSSGLKIVKRGVAAPSDLRVSISERGRAFTLDDLSPVARQLPAHQQSRTAMDERSPSRSVSPAMSRRKRQSNAQKLAASCKTWAEFTPSPDRHSLTTEQRQETRARVRATLLNHFLFSDLQPRGLDELVRAMRYSTVPAGSELTVEGQQHSKFYVCISGGFNILRKISPQSPPQRISQAPPGYTFGSAALLREGSTAHSSAVAAVNSEVFSLTRDVYIRCKRVQAAVVRDGTAISALQRLKGLSLLPQPLLEKLSRAMLPHFVAAGSSDGMQPLGDNWMFILTGGTVTMRPSPEASALSRAPSYSSVSARSVGSYKERTTTGSYKERTTTEDRHTATSSSGAGGGLGSGSIVRRYWPHDGATMTMGAGSVLAAGRAGEEGLLAALFNAGNDALLDDGSRGEEVGGNLMLLRGQPEAWTIEATDGEASGFAMRLDDVADLLTGLPLLLARPLGIRSHLQCMPVFGDSPNVLLDSLSFSFAATSFQKGKPLVVEGRQSSWLHLLVAGAVQLSASRPKGESAALGRCTAGDTLGQVTTFTEAKAEAATAVALVDCVALSIERSVARTVIPLSLQQALLDHGAAALIEFPTFDKHEYHVEKLLGSGAFGTVAAVRRTKTNEVFALKKVPRRELVDHGMQGQLLVERAALASCNHPFIIRLRGTLRQQEALFLLIELCDGPELYAVLQQLGPRPEAEVRMQTACVVSALDYLHTHGWMYRDLKAENVVYCLNGYIKLVDFGLAKFCKGRLYTVCGSVEYMAPEVVRQDGYGTAADWWSFGCLLYELLFGHTPWLLTENGDADFSLSDKDITRNVMDAKYRISYPAKPPLAVSVGARELIEGLLQRNVNLRLGNLHRRSADIRTHPFFGDLDWSALESQQLAMPAVPTLREKGAADAAGDEADDELTPLDPLSAALLAFAKEQRNGACSASSLGAPAAAPVADASKPVAPAYGYGWRSSSSMASVGGDESVSLFLSGTPCSARDVESGSWDREF